MMKMRHVMVAALLAVGLCACATDSAQVVATPVHQVAAAPPAPELSKWESFAAAIASAKDNTAQVAIAVAFAAGSGSSQAPAPQVVIPPARHWAVELVLGAAQFAKDATIALAPSIASVMASRTNARVQERVAEFQRDRDIATVAGFTSMGAQIGAAGVAGYGFIQAPGAITTTTTTNTTTNTVSGTGVVGSGTNTGPVTRTCNGGGAGAGAGTTTGAPGGAGGPASC